MNQITRLSRHLAMLMKLRFLLDELEGKNWRSQDVWRIAIEVRNSFNEFDQKWRNVVIGNPFFVFCIPTGGFYLDGGGVFQHNPLDSEEVTQQNLVEGRKMLKMQIPDLMAQMLEARNNLLSLQNQNRHISVFQDFDKLSGDLARIVFQARTGTLNADIELQNWLIKLIETLKRHGLNTRFNPAFDDSSKHLLSRVERREEVLQQILDSLASTPTEREVLTVNNNFGNNNTFGVFNNGIVQEISNIKISVEELSKDYPKVAEEIARISALVAEADADDEIKERALDALSVVSTELIKPEGERKSWKISENLEKLAGLAKSAAKLGGALAKLLPYITSLTQAIRQHFPNIPTL